MLPQEEIDEQLELLRIHRRTLATYLRQQATIGEAFSPPALLNGILETRTNIQRIKSALRAGGVSVPEDIDDIAPPPIVITMRRAGSVPAGILVTVAGAVLLIVLGASLGVFSLPLLSRATPTSILALNNPTAAPANTASVAAAPGPIAVSATAAPAQPTIAPVQAGSQTLVLQYTFADGTPGNWNGNPAQWQVIQDGADFVYQVEAGDQDAASTPPDADELALLADYAVETRVKLVKTGLPGSTLPDIWLSLRAPLNLSGTCASYNFMLSQINADAMIFLAGNNPGCGQVLAENPFTLEVGRWYDLRAEVSGDHLILSVDGTVLVSTTDATRKQGFFYFNVGPGVTAQFANVRVYQLASQ